MNISKVGEKQNALFISHVLTLRGSDNRRSKLYCYQVHMSFYKPLLLDYDNAIYIDLLLNGEKPAILCNAVIQKPFIKNTSNLRLTGGPNVSLVLSSI